ncbi:MAG TPA: hypothetical protein VMY78_04625 [Solirubrobacteraceae bacterium]|nr:hypothetical protein [Solirubrobacteraceae bacterium]
MRKKVVSILKLPLRLLRRIFGFLGFLVRPFRAVFRKLPSLRGRQRIIAFGVLGVLVVVAVLVLRPGPDAEKDVRATLDRYATATRDKDYQTLCDDLYAKELIDRLQSVNLPCEVALRTALDNVQNPQLTVLGVEVNGDQALARARSTAVGEVASQDTIRLVKQDGDWRVSSLSQPGSDFSGDIVP